MTSNAFCFMKPICLMNAFPQNCCGKSSVTTAPRSITSDGANEWERYAGSDLVKQATIQTLTISIAKYFERLVISFSLSWQRCLVCEVRPSE